MAPRKGQPSWVLAYPRKMTSLTIEWFITHLPGGSPFSLFPRGWEDIPQMKHESIEIHHTEVNHCDIKFLPFFLYFTVPKLLGVPLALSTCCYKLTRMPSLDLGDAYSGY